LESFDLKVLGGIKSHLYLISLTFGPKMSELELEGVVQVVEHLPSSVNVSTAKIICYFKLLAN
jgi:hypothetical protein